RPGDAGRRQPAHATVSLHRLIQLSGQHSALSGEGVERGEGGGNFTIEMLNPRRRSSSTGPGSPIALLGPKIQITRPRGHCQYGAESKKSNYQAKCSVRRPSGIPRRKKRDNGRTAAELVKENECLCSPRRRPVATCFCIWRGRRSDERLRARAWLRHEIGGSKSGSTQTGDRRGRTAKE
ncbi:hypothetical protein T310_8745, partial [Rasamsonia emersonii CBS 393.64]